MLLHSTDRAYTVPQVHEWLASAGMRLARFIMPMLYNPSFYSATLDVSALDEPSRQAAAELLHGRMQKHSFFAAPVEAPEPHEPSWHDLTATPTWLRFDHDNTIGRRCTSGRSCTCSTKGSSCGWRWIPSGARS
ncbi:MAG: hypothetical protein IPG47_17145 [Thermoflexaceae bacterium]|nr:hypothetical protein [Thermoflexaceae bacterium]